MDITIGFDGPWTTTPAPALSIWGGGRGERRGGSKPRSRYPYPLPACLHVVSSAARSGLSPGFAVAAVCGVAGTRWNGGDDETTRAGSGLVVPAPVQAQSNPARGGMWATRAPGSGSYPQLQISSGSCESCLPVALRGGAPHGRLHGKRAGPAAASKARQFQATGPSEWASLLPPAHWPCPLAVALPCPALATQHWPAARGWGLAGCCPSFPRNLRVGLGRAALALSPVASCCVTHTHPLSLTRNTAATHQRCNPAAGGAPSQIGGRGGSEGEGKGGEAERWGCRLATHSIHIPQQTPGGFFPLRRTTHWLPAQQTPWHCPRPRSVHRPECVIPLDLADGGSVPGHLHTYPLQITQYTLLLLLLLL